MLYHEQTISGEETHTLITFMASMMAYKFIIYWLIILQAMYTSARFCYIVRLPIYVTC